MLALCAVAPSAWGAPGGRPFEASGAVGIALFLLSDYRHALDVFGQSGPAVGVQLAARGLWGLARHLRLGFRAGYTFSTTSQHALSGELGTTLLPFDSVSFHLLDAGVVLRLGTGPTTSPRVAFDLEVGPSLNLITWRSNVDATVVPRLGAAFVIGGTPQGFFASARLGFQWVPSGGAGGLAFSDPAFAGATLGVELGGGR